jgi:hypothetical protein
VSTQQRMTQSEGRTRRSGTGLIVGLVVAVLAASVVIFAVVGGMGSIAGSPSEATQGERQPISPNGQAPRPIDVEGSFPPRPQPPQSQQSVPLESPVQVQVP